MATTVPSTVPARRRLGTVALWTVQIALAAAFAGGGLVKLAGDPVMVDLFDRVGAGQWLRYLVGALELAAAVGLLVPRLAKFAAAGLVLLMVGAAVTNVAIIDESPLMPLAYLVVAGIVAWRRHVRDR